MANDLVANRLDNDFAVFRARFWRCHRLLHLIACRILNSSKQGNRAIENCWLKASRNPPRFEYEGAFRSWLVRVLMDEALALLHQDRQKEKAGVPSESIPEGSFVETICMVQKAEFGLKNQIQSGACK